MRILWLAFLLVLTLATGACVPGYTVTEGGEPVSITGRLDGELRDGVECAWIVDERGKLTYLLWFEEGVVLVEPFRFIDSAGSVVARAGDIVTVIGPEGAIGETICATPGEAIFAVDVITGPEGTLAFPTAPPFEP